MPSRSRAGSREPENVMTFGWKTQTAPRTDGCLDLHLKSIVRKKTSWKIIGVQFKGRESEIFETKNVLRN